MANKTWKNTERQRLLPFSAASAGSYHGTAAAISPDIRTIFLAWSEAQKQLPEWLHDAMRQAVASLRTDQQLPVVILHEKGNGTRRTICHSSGGFARLVWLGC